MRRGFAAARPKGSLHSGEQLNERLKLGGRQASHTGFLDRYQWWTELIDSRGTCRSELDKHASAVGRMRFALDQPSAFERIQDASDGLRWHVQNPISKERVALLSAAVDVLRLEEQVPPEMVPPPAHVHSHQAECFEVVEGRATVVVSGVERTLMAGQSLTIEAGTPHTWQNSGDGGLRMITEFRPAGQMQSFFETFCGLASEGRCDNKGQPAFLQIVVSAADWDMYLAGPPVLAQRALFALLRPLAWARGYRPRYARFNGTLAPPG